MFEAIVEVSQGHVNADLHVGTPALTRSMSKVTATTKEAGEQVEGVLVSASATLLVVL